MCDINLPSDSNIIIKIIPCTKPFENTVGKGEIARNDPSCFSILWKTFPPLSSNLKLLSANFFVVLERMQDAILEIQAKLLSTVLTGTMERLSGHPHSEWKCLEALKALALLNAPQAYHSSSMFSWKTAQLKNFTWYRLFLYRFCYFHSIIFIVQVI